MLLHRLSITNFKGIRSLTLEPEGRSFDAFGANATGKTTIADAFHFLLFGKDSQGQADFAIKTLGSDGEPIHGLDHSVEADLELEDGRRVNLKRVYHEVWTKRRGEAKREMTGHTTDLFVDGVPLQKKDFDAEIERLMAPEGVFRLLTDPLQFAERLHWAERRKTLLEICGDVTVEDVVAVDAELAELPRLLGARSLDDHRKVLNSRKAEINRELDRLPVRIDEVSKGLPELPPDLTEPAAEARVTELRTEREAAEQERQRIETGGEVAEKTRALREVEAELLAFRNRLTIEQEAREAALRAAETQAKAARDEALRKARAVRASNLETAEEIAALERRMTAERERFERINAEEFRHSAPDSCAACGQPLPAERVAEAREKALAAWNEEKARRLGTIREEGQRLKARRDELAGGGNDRDSALAAAEQEAERLEAETVRAQIALEEAHASAPDPVADPEYARLAERREALRAKITELGEGNSAALAACAARIGTLTGEIREAEARLALFAQRRKGEARIEELKGQERSLSEDFEEQERQLALLDKFERRRAELLESRVAGRFKLARFQLFAPQVNGGLSPTCEVTYGGVPYSSGLNHGARIAVGLDIISTLQSHFKFKPPCWVDQAESFTSLPEMDCQVIRLVVSAADEKLRIETEGA